MPYSGLALLKVQGCLTQLIQANSTGVSAWTAMPGFHLHLAQLLSNLSLETWDLDQDQGHTALQLIWCPLIWGQQHVVCWFWATPIHFLTNPYKLSLKSSFTSVSKDFAGKGKALEPLLQQSSSWLGRTEWHQSPDGLAPVSLSGLHVRGVSSSHSPAQAGGEDHRWTAKGWFSLPSQSRVETSAHSSGGYTLAFTF